MDDITKKELKDYINELHSTLTLWQKVKNTCAFFYYLSPIGYIFHHETFVLFKKATALTMEAIKD